MLDAGAEAWATRMRPYAGLLTPLVDRAASARVHGRAGTAMSWSASPVRTDGSAGLVLLATLPTR